MWYVMLTSGHLYCRVWMSLVNCLSTQQALPKSTILHSAELRAAVRAMALLPPEIKGWASSKSAGLLKHKCTDSFSEVVHKELTSLLCSKCEAVEDACGGITVIPCSLDCITKLTKPQDLGWQCQQWHPKLFASRAHSLIRKLCEIGSPEAARFLSFLLSACKRISTHPAAPEGSAAPSDLLLSGRTDPRWSTLDPELLAG